MKNMKNVKKDVNLGSVLNYLENDSGIGSLKQVT